jgi:hypothetical protein
MLDNLDFLLISLQVILGVWVVWMFKDDLLHHSKNDHHK